MVTPSTSLGSMSLVNCSRWKVQETERASACANVVLPTPGTSSISRCPRAKRHTSERLTASGLPRSAEPSMASSSDSLASGCAMAAGGASIVSRVGIIAILLNSMTRTRAEEAGSQAGPLAPPLLSLRGERAQDTVDVMRCFRKRRDSTELLHTSRSGVVGAQRACEIPAVLIEQLLQQLRSRSHVLLRIVRIGDAKLRLHGRHQLHETLSAFDRRGAGIV